MYIHILCKIHYARPMFITREILRPFGRGGQPRVVRSQEAGPCRWDQSKTKAKLPFPEGLSTETGSTKAQSSKNSRDRSP